MTHGKTTPGIDTPSTDDYLWDPSAEATPDIAQLESALAGMRHRPTAYHRPTSRRAVLLAALLIITATVAIVFSRFEDDSLPMSGLDGTARLLVGRWIEPSSPVRIEIGSFGHITVEPDSRLRLLKTGSDEHRMELARGFIDAFVTAPPRMFFVETPAGVAADLGCAYTLEVDDAGLSALHVTLGWVELERHGRTATVPSGAGCIMSPATGLGTPVFDDSADAFKTALQRFDQDPADLHAFDEVLRIAMVQDTLSLWHLLPGVNASLRDRVFNRLNELSPAPEEVTRAGVGILDDAMLYRWWNSIQREW